MQYEQLPAEQQAEKPKMLKLDGLIWSILILTILTNSSYAIIAPFLPFEFKKLDIDQVMAGYLFSVYSVAVIICSPFIGKVMQKTGRRNILTAGMMIMGCSFVVFGLLSFVDKETYIMLALVNRFL